MGIATAAPAKIAPLTSLRFVAAAMIVILHGWPVFGIGSIVHQVPLAQGVSFFFVLSGFVLAYNYPALASRGDAARFWVARFARVWPLHAAITLMWIALMLALGRPVTVAAEPDAVGLAVNLLLLQAWLPFDAGAFSYNPVSWSLSAELFFYAMFPLLIAAWNANWRIVLGLQVIVVGATLLAMAHVAFPAEWERPGTPLRVGVIYFIPAMRLLEFTAGIAVATLVARFRQAGVALHWSGWLAVEAVALGALLAALLAMYDVPTLHHLPPTVVTYLTANGLWLFWGGLIFAMAVSQGPLAALLRLPPLVFLGEISFALYLVHMMVLRYFEEVAGGALQGWLPYGGFWLACLALSALLHGAVERPARALVVGWWRRRAATPGSRPVVSLRMAALRHAAGLLAVSAVVAGMVWMRPGTVRPIDEATARDFLDGVRTYAVSEGGHFDGKVSVLGVRVRESGTGRATISVLLRSEERIDRDVQLAVHLVDPDGRMVLNAGAAPLEGQKAAIPAGVTWIVTRNVSREVAESAHAIGLAVYVRSEKLFKVTGKATDWSGRRLILPVRL